MFQVIEDLQEDQLEGIPCRGIPAASGSGAMPGEEHPFADVLLPLPRPTQVSKVGLR